MSSRRRSREVALQMLYGADIVDIAEQGDQGDDLFIESEETISDTVREYAEEIARGTIDKSAEIDAMVESYSENWKVKRMPLVDRNILRLAVYELLYCPDTPYKVVIDEAIELAKRFGSDKAAPFINGVLDRIHTEAS
ncbi:MAG: transcription antitermination factor NusB [Proteobacteria bacterium]|nr:transcription antitermination factor NusB [Pseudomonadota bacterium]